MYANKKLIESMWACYAQIERILSSILVKLKGIIRLKKFTGRLPMIFWQGSSMALGGVGLIPEWSPMLQNKIRRQAGEIWKFL